MDSLADRRVKAGLCTAYVCHGPGHQSRTFCDVEGEHDVHGATYGEFNQRAEWRDFAYTNQLRAKGIEFDPASYPDDIAMTGYFDEPPSLDAE